MFIERFNISCMCFVYIQYCGGAYQLLDYLLLLWNAWYEETRGYSSGHRLAANKAVSYS